MIDRNTAVIDIRSHWRDLLPALGLDRAKQRVNGELSYVCPLCQNGSGRNGDGLTFIPGGNTLKCFKCGFTGDVLDLYQQMTGATFAAAVDNLSQALGIDVEPLKHKRNAADYFRMVDDDGTEDSDQSAEASVSAVVTAPSAAEADKRESAERGTPTENADPEAPEGLYRDYIRECESRLTSPEALAYLKRRGISLEAARRYRVGYDPEFISPTAVRKLRSEGKAWRPAPTPRLILPADNGSAFLARDIRSNLDDQARRYQKMNEVAPGASMGLSGAEFLDGTEPVFVVESVADAMSVAEVGGRAISLNSTSNAGLLLDLLKADGPEGKPPLLLALDADGAGLAAGDKLATALDSLNADYERVHISGTYKDPNEALTGDPERFRLDVTAAIEKTSPKPDSILSYLNSGGLAADIESFKKNVRPTGFTHLDELTGGGLHTGLYIIAAVPSLGKTTFCWQIADYLAASGSDVLYFALEQGKTELILKSLARRAALHDQAEGVELQNIKFSSTAMRKGYYSTAMTAAAEMFKLECGDRLSVIEAQAGTSAKAVGDYVGRYVRRNHVTPVVVVDYVQLLRAPDDRMDIRVGLVETSKALRGMVRELGLTMICISSVNRANYNSEFDFETLKESGSLEFDADFVAGLQLEAVHDPVMSDDRKSASIKRQLMKAEKRKTPRKVELTVAKNRFGPANFSDHFSYWPAFDLFIEENEAGEDLEWAAAAAAAAASPRRKNQRRNQN